MKIVAVIPVKEISERVKSTKTRMRKSGRYLGGKNILFGKKLSADGKTYVDDEKDKDNPKAHFHSMLEAIEDTIYMDQGNVNLSLNAISLIFDIQSCLRGNEYHPVIKF